MNDVEAKDAYAGKERKPNSSGPKPDQKPLARASPGKPVSEKWKKSGTSVHTEEKAAPVQVSRKKAAESDKPKYHVIWQTVQDAAHRRVQEDEEENTGLQALHESEQVTETLWQHGGHAVESWKHHGNKSTVRKEGSNPLSHSQQKWSMKRQYISRNHGASFAAGGSSRQTVRQGAAIARNTAQNLIRRVRTKKPTVLLLALGGLLLIIMYSISACTPMLEAAMTAMTMGTYPAQEADVRAAEAIYAQKERLLQEEIKFPDRFYPDCDEYIVNAQEIWHDPYALISLISAYLHGEGWTADSAMPVIDMLFAWQYEKEVTITTEQRYHTETVNGRETKVWHDVNICTISLKNKNLSHAPVYIMDEERVGMYALYMSTLGNMPDVFAGWPHASALKEPMEYEVPQAAKDADPKFAALIAEAEKYIGWPYVWGGYNPTTSLDCAGFISWVYTQSGVANIGRWAASGINAICRHISPTQARPGDIVFFAGTIEGETGVTHCGIYVGDSKMIHFGNPCSFADLNDAYWQQHLAGYGRVY